MALKTSNKNRKKSIQNNNKHNINTQNTPNDVIEDIKKHKNIAITITVIALILMILI